MGKIYYSDLYFVLAFIYILLNVNLVFLEV